MLRYHCGDGEKRPLFQHDSITTVARGVRCALARRSTRVCPTFDARVPDVRRALARRTPRARISFVSPQHVVHFPPPLQSYVFMVALL